MRNKRIIFSGGGTGGHIYPAISIANELLLNDKNLEILFIGANNKMEMKIVPEHGFDILGFPIESFGDEMTISKSDNMGVRITKVEGYPIPSDPKKNVATVSAK